MSKNKNKELDREELLFIAMKSLWIMEGQVQTLEAYLAAPPSKEESMAMLRALREKRSSLERLVEEYSGAEVTAPRLKLHE